MSKWITFKVGMKPVGKGRPRFAGGRAYTPKNTRDAELVITQACERAYHGIKPLTGAVSADIQVFCSLPKSRPKAVESEPYTFKPDIDNIAKLILDAINGIAYEDDSQVVDLRVRKFPRTRECEQGYVISLKELDTDGNK